MRSFTRKIGTALFVAVGLLNLAPGLVALLPSRLDTYGVVAADATSTLLLRHRAVLLALLGAALLAAAVVPNLRMPVLAGAAIGKVSFILLVFTGSGVHPNLTPVALADAGALVALAVAGVFTVRSRVRPSLVIARKHKEDARLVPE